ncbi:MAG TPA: glycoside hydrolase family 43 protein [Acidimicrobiales bacterium]|nr:glycoside hydrolase family 43 protein [Acidimicrobiales bacterium]
MTNGVSTGKRAVLVLIAVAMLVMSPSPAGAIQLQVQLSDTALVYSGDAPDPSILHVAGISYAYTTGSGADNISLLESTDQSHWEPIGDALPVLPAWAQAGYTWSPSIAAAPGGGYELFFDAYDDATGLQCIGRATSATPSGPFIDAESAPFLCQRDLGGSIDASVYHRGDGDILVWKSDGNVGIWSQKLGPDDASLIGAPVLLLSPSASWENGVVEGPTLVNIDGTLTLWFSAGQWSGAGYEIGMVVCSSPLGPCDVDSVSRELATGPGLTGPGGPSFYRADGQLKMAFAAWTDGVRGLYLADVANGGVQGDIASSRSQRSTRSAADSQRAHS